MTARDAPPLRRVLFLLAALLACTAGQRTAWAAPPAAGIFPRTSSGVPRYVTARIRRSESVLVAGDTGYLDIDLSLPAPGPAGVPPSWDRGTIPPILWVSSTPQSGIVFDDQIPEDKPRHHIVVRLPIPKEETATLTARVKYSVSARAKAGDHTLYLEVAAPLVAPDGTKIEDTGVVREPFQVDTRLRVKLTMLAVIAVAIFLFVVEWVRVDVVAIIIMVLLPELGLIEATDTFRGLSSNAVVAIIGVMIISFGLNRVGIVSRVIRPFLRFIGHSPSRLIVVFSSMIAAISSVMQNTGAAVLFLPGIRMAACKKLGVPLSRVLMPIGMAAILGGTLTMVGTSPLILLNDLLPAGMPRFGLLELTPIGIALVAFGIAYLSLAAKLSLGKGPVSEYELPTVGDRGGCIEQYEELDGPFELFVPGGKYNATSAPLEVVRIRRERHVNIVALRMEGGGVIVAPAPGTTISNALGLLVFGKREAVESFAGEYKLTLREEPRLFRNGLVEPAVAGVVEVVISPRSTFVGRTIGAIGFRETFQVSALALHQGGKTHYESLADRPLHAGDAILIHGTWEQLHSLQEHHQNFIIISRRETEFQIPEKAKPALACFFSALVLMLISSLYFQIYCDYNPIPLSVCLMIGAAGMILTRVVSITEAYRAVDWRTVFLLGGLIPLGMAVSQTGTARWIASGLVGALGESVHPIVLLLVLATLSGAFTLVISNVGACALLVPLGMSMAAQTGIDPRVAAIVVGIGVSNSFILPTHQVNALYMGPGEYKTTDYARIGGMLSLLYIAVLVLTVYFLYM